MMEYSLDEICGRIEGRLEGDGNCPIRGVGALESAGIEEITFAESARHHDKAVAGQAAAIIVGDDFPQIPGRNLIRVAQPRLAFLRTMELFVAPPEVTGIHPDASISDRAELAEDVSVGACAVIAEGVFVGARTIIEAGAYIGPDVTIGEDCCIEANAVVLKGSRLGNRVIIHAGATIGGEGFGFVWLEDHHHKVPQLGIVQIDDDVEVGCNSCVDRATLGVTRIRRGTKIDNQVQIAHNNDVGEDVVMAGQFGTAGSVTIGNRVVFGGRTCVADHLTIGENAMVGGASAVIKNIEPGAVVFGMPAKDKRQAFLEIAHIGRLPELSKKVKAQEELIESLQQRLDVLEGRSH